MTSPWARRVLLLAAGGLAALGGLLLLRAVGDSLSPAAVRDALGRVEARAGGFPVAPFVLVAVLAAVLVVPIIPASILQIGSGLAFGPLWGLIYALLADMLGAAAGFFLARRWGPRTLRRWLKPATIEGVERLARRLDWKGVILLRLLPGPAYPLVSFAAGLAPLSPARYLLASFGGVLPSIMLLVVAGDVATASPVLAAVIVVALVGSLVLAGRLLRREGRAG